MLGLAATLAIPAGIGAARYSPRIDLIPAGIAAIGAGCLLGLVSILLARRARRRLQRTLGRSRGRHAARLGRGLAVLGILAALTGALALGFYRLLQYFAG